MNTYRIRRATVDDLQSLLILWQAAELPATELEKRLTEFQVVEDTNGQLVGALGIQIEGHVGNLHSETFADFSLTDALRPLIWDKIQTLSITHGLYRLWTHEDAPFWKKDAGFAEPNEEIKKKFPPAFGSLNDKWLSLWLRDEPVLPTSIEKQIELARQESEAQYNSLMGKASTFNIIKSGLVTLLLFALIGVLIYGLVVMNR
mgnify:CR=1 FL=1